MAQNPPQIALIGAGIFVKSQYLPRLAEISELVVLKAIWSRSEKSANEAAEIARKVFPNVECKWDEAGLDDILIDEDIIGVIVALPGQIQANMSLKLLYAGKHVLQEKPAASFIGEAEGSLLCYGGFSKHPIFAVAENYRFEPAFAEGRKLMSEIGDMMSVQVIIEGSMNSSNPYFSSSWRRDFKGGFILDMGVHYIAGLRMLVGSEVAIVSAMQKHVDTTLPEPDTISSIFQLENGCHGVFVMLVSSKTPKIVWRVVGLNGTVEVERGNKDGQHGYVVTLFAKGETKSTFYPFCGVSEELKAFINDISRAGIPRDRGDKIESDSRYSYIEGARDVAVLDAMLDSARMEGESVVVNQFEEILNKLSSPTFVE